MVGKPMPIEYRLLSVTNQTRFFVDRGRLTDIEVEVIDANGKALQSKVNADRGQGIEDYKRMFIRLRESEPIKMKFDLGTYFDISQSGIYQVTVTCPIAKEDRTKCEARSKPLTITVNHTK